MKSHTPADGIPFFPDAKYVVVGRDGRDAFMSLCNHMERFKLIDVLNARAPADGVPPMPGWDGDVHGFFSHWLEDGAHTARTSARSGSAAATRASCSCTTTI